MLLTLPDWGDFDPKRQLEELRVLIEEGRKLADRKANTSESDTEPIFLPWERLHDRIAKAWGPLSHLHGVDQESYSQIVETYEEGDRLLSAYATDIGQHEGLFAAYRLFAKGETYRELGTEERRIIDEAIIDFELSGVALPKEQKTRLREINARLSELSARYSQNIQSAQNAWSKLVSDPSVLDGVSQETIAAMRSAAKREGKDGYLVTIHQPIFIALIEQAKNADLRREIYEAYHTRASDQGPTAGRFDNGPIMEEIIALRSESAKILGYPSFNAYRLTKRMAPSVEDVSAFLHELESRAVPKAKEEFALLREFAASELGISEPQPWDIAFIARIMKERTFGIDQEALRAYFPEDRVLKSLFGLLGRIYGIELRERTDIPVWRDGVRFFEVKDGNRTIGGVYADLYSRRGKRPGAWMDSAVERFVNDGAIQLPVAYFNCNFLPQEGKRATLRHDEVETIFHEFGHVIHHLLGETRYPSTGMGRVEWDAVEFPSQIMENWCWEREMLKEMTAHVESGEPMPGEMIERLIASRTYHIGLFLARQLTLASFDWALHLEAEGKKSPQKLWDEIQARIMPMPYPAWSRYPNAFSHIFDGGYAAGYYSYLWAEVLAADAYRIFRAQGIFDRETGTRFRREILSMGSIRPMMEGFRAFCGREPDPKALLVSYGIDT
jgi:oligopeptidase A